MTFQDQLRNVPLASLHDDLRLVPRRLQLHRDGRDDRGRRRRHPEKVSGKTRQHFRDPELKDKLAPAEKLRSERPIVLAAAAGPDFEDLRKLRK